MSVQAPTPTGFNLYDLLARITPGVFILIIVIATTLDTAVLLSYTDSSAFSAFVLFAGFLIGELVDSFRMSHFAAPKTFRYLIYEERGEDSKSLTKFGRIRNWISSPNYSIDLEARESFWNDFRQQFDTGDGFGDANEIYLQLHTYLAPQLTSHAQRYQTMTIFVQNLRIGAAFSVIWIFFVWLLNHSEAAPEMRGIMLSISLFVLLYVSYFNGPERVYVRLLLVAFSVDQPKEEG